MSRHENENAPGGRPMPPDWERMLGGIVGQIGNEPHGPEDGPEPAAGGEASADAKPWDDATQTIIGEVTGDAVTGVRLRECHANAERVMRALATAPLPPCCAHPAMAMLMIERGMGQLIATYPKNGMGMGAQLTHYANSIFEELSPENSPEEIAFLAGVLLCRSLGMTAEWETLTLPEGFPKGGDR